MHLIGFNATEPAWTATGGSWCMDETCTWRADAATVRTFGSHMHWISDTGGTFTVNLHSAGGATVLASQTITVSSGG